MSHLSSNYGIIVENGERRLTFFDTDNFNILHQIPLNLDLLDVDISPDSSRAVATAFYDRAIIQIDLSSEPPTVVQSQETDDYVEDVSISADGHFALTSDGDSYGSVYVYDLANKAISFQMSLNAQAIAVSPNGSSLVLTAKYFESKLRSYILDASGTLTHTGQELAFADGFGPINISFSPDGVWVFVANFESDNLGVVKIFSETMVVLGTFSTHPCPQTIVVSRNGKRLYVLTDEYVDVFEFDSSTISILYSFPHNMPRSQIGYYGVDQMDLDNTETKLFICANDQSTPELKVFAVDGTPLGTVPDIKANAGIRIRPPIYPSRGFDFRILR